MTGLEILMSVVNAGLLIVAYLFREAHQDVKIRLVKLEDNAVRKDDFKEFKEELFRRLDRFEIELKGKNG